MKKLLRLIFLRIKNRKLTRKLRKYCKQNNLQFHMEVCGDCVRRYYVDPKSNKKK